MEKETEILLADWFRRARESQSTHYECASHFSRMNYLLGIPTIGLSAAVGTAVFASFVHAVTGEMRLIVGLISMVATMLSGLQTFLGFARRADQHRATGAGYGAIRRSFEHLKTFPPDSRDDLRRAMADLKKEMDDLAATSPEVPRAIKRRVDRELKSRAHRRVFRLEPTETQPEAE